MRGKKQVTGGESGYSYTSSFPRKRESSNKDSFFLDPRVKPEDDIFIEAPEDDRKDESGRSMVETLGVLAIMGLLAVGGIMAYRYAVDKYRSNELWNNVKWISVQVMTDGSLQGMSNGDEMTVKSFSGDSELILKRETAIGYSVRTGNLRESTCRQIRRDKPDWVEEVVSNEGGGCQDREDNDIKIYFNGQLNSETTDEDRYKRCERDEDCGDCGKCSEEKICVDYDALCQAPTPYCINGSCEPCPAGETLNSSGKCQACPADENSTFRVTNDEAGAAACHKCGNWFKLGQTCRSCNIMYSAYVDSEECYYCSNRYWDGSGGCHICNETRARGPIPRVDCNRCPNRYMPGDSESGTCYYCDGMVSADRKSCIWACPTGTFGGKDKCVDCETGPQAVQFNWGLLSHETEKEFCDTCANRVFLFQQNPAPGICAKKCREGQFLDGTGNCRTCDDGSFYMGWTETMGQVGSSYDMTLPSCRSCDGMVPQAVTNANCIPCDSTSDPIQTWYGTGDCARCPGRIEVFNDYYEPWRVLCVFPCDQNQIHDGNSGTCYDCEEIDNHGRTTVAQCHTCENRFVFRGDCRHCSDPGSFFISTEECLRCKGKRYTTATVSWQSGECRLCPEKDSAEWQALSPTFQEQCND